MSWLKQLLCQKEIQESEDWYFRFRKCEDELDLLKTKLVEDTKYYDQQIKFLTEQLNNQFRVPKFKFDQLLATKPRQIFGNLGIKIETGDLDYWAPPLEKWKEILTTLHQKVTQKYQTNSFDCDNFALMMASLVSESAYASGLNQQLAFGIAWSTNTLGNKGNNAHAFNFFIDYNGVIYLYEPQTNVILPWNIGIKGNLNYTVNSAWILA